MTNSYPSGSPGVPDSSMPTGAPGFMPRRSSYASVVSGTASGAPYQQPARSGAFSHLLNQNADFSYDPSYQNFGGHQRYDHRTYDMDFHTGGSSHGRSGSWGRGGQLHPFSSAFAAVVSGNGYGNFGGSSTEQFFIPSYLKGSRYLQRLEEAHKAKIAAQKDSQSAPSSQPGSLSTSASSVNLHTKMASSYRGIAHDVIEKAPPSKDETLTPLPSKWNSLDKYGGLEVLNDGMEVKFSGPKSERDRDHEACAIRADHPMPSQCGIYYFEVDIVSRKREESSIGIGFSTKNVPLSRLPGWEPESYAYHGDDGHSFCCQSSGKHYGPPFNSGDVIGCGVNFRTGCAFFTKNGDHLGTAFRDIKENKGKLFPSVGMKKAGEHIRVNFGQRPFVFDIDGMMSASNTFSYPHSPLRSDIPGNGSNNQENGADAAGAPESSLEDENTASIQEHFIHREVVPPPLLPLEAIPTGLSIHKNEGQALPAVTEHAPTAEATDDPGVIDTSANSANHSSTPEIVNDRATSPAREETLGPFNTYDQARAAGRIRQLEANSGELDSSTARPYITLNTFRTRRGYETRLYTWHHALEHPTIRRISSASNATVTPATADRNIGSALLQPTTVTDLSLVSPLDSPPPLIPLDGHTPTSSGRGPYRQDLDSSNGFSQFPSWGFAETSNHPSGPYLSDLDSLQTANENQIRLLRGNTATSNSVLSNATRDLTESASPRNGTYISAVRLSRRERRPTITYQEFFSGTQSPRPRRTQDRSNRPLALPYYRHSFTSRNPRQPPPSNAIESQNFLGISGERPRRSLHSRLSSAYDALSQVLNEYNGPVHTFDLSGSGLFHPLTYREEQTALAQNGHRVFHGPDSEIRQSTANQNGHSHVTSPPNITTIIGQQYSTAQNGVGRFVQHGQGAPHQPSSENPRAPGSQPPIGQSSNDANHAAEPQLQSPVEQERSTTTNSLFIALARIPQISESERAQVALLQAQIGRLRQDWISREISKVMWTGIRANYSSQREKKQIRQEIEATSTAKLAPPMDETELIQALVLQALAHDGYVETARAFAEEVHAEKKALSLDPNEVVKGFDVKEDEDASHRQRIRTAVLEGDVDKALKYTNAYYPSVLKDNEHVYFRLRCRKFIEMVRQAAELQNASSKIIKKSNGHNGDWYDDIINHDMELDDHPNSNNYDRMDTEELPESQNEHLRLLQDTLVYGTELQAEFKDDPRREVKKGLDDIFALMAYEDPLKVKEVSHLLDPGGRMAVAEELNSAILLSLGKSSSAALERLYQQTYVLLEDLREGGGAGSLVNIDDFVRPKSGS
ncbi:uncharacterized protein LY89DRAFT_48210 [Mollisia scopiformis]|uniref:Uncharacterized protein n=1 Tax=Mollisia scopiformis TaxID=149040 RepID=A0A194XE15_MOLSC|nr:uncharacterized protein LY89DRAFT_48210 [Mollisia scopiformis]KUJ18418.1 hypothetical protein LY89DRAFT_48210 [Mollisia scopiformis]